MQAGTLDRRIAIYTPTATQDGAGQPVEGWSVFCTVWANVEHLRGSEPFQGEQFNAQRKSIFTIRYRSDLNETMQIIYDNETYEITSIIERDRREVMEIATLALVTA